MIRSRFKVNAEDPRPVHWPIKHPYWCTGYDADEDDQEYAILVAYADDEDEILRNWPDARDLESLRRRRQAAGPELGLKVRVGSGAHQASFAGSFDPPMDPRV